MKSQHFAMTFLLMGMLASSTQIQAQATGKPSFTVEGEVLKPLKLTLDTGFLFASGI